MAPRKKNPKLKRTIKYLATCKHPEIISGIIVKSPVSVIKSIFDAALNAARGKLSLKPKEKKILASHRRLIERLIQRAETAKSKRHLLSQTGRFILGLVIPTVYNEVKRLMSHHVLLGTRPMK